MAFLDANWAGSKVIVERRSPLVVVAFALGDGAVLAGVNSASILSTTVEALYGFSLINFKPASVHSVRGG